MSARPPLPRRRKWLFRLGALALAPLLFGVLELVFLACGMGKPAKQDDPFLGFEASYPLFALNEKEGRYEIAENRREWFYPTSFPAKKAANAFRVFCLGESTLVGHPFTHETSFTAWLQLMLAHNDPARDWQVINCGGVSYASYRLIPILQEALNYQPDLVIVYSGHNEFLEDRTYRHLKEKAENLGPMFRWASQSRTFNVMRDGYRKIAGGGTKDLLQARPILKAEVDALLEHEGGMEFYYRDPEWHRGVIDHYRANLTRMAELCQAAKVPLILSNPVANIRDTPPFKSEPKAGLTEEQAKEITEIRENARHMMSQQRYEVAVAAYEEALEIDDQDASLHYELAKALDISGRWEDAKRQYTLAKDLDVCPLRILSSMNEVVLQVAKETGVSLVDIKAEVEKIVRNGIPGDGETGGFLDHVHPNVAGHQFFAKLYAEEMQRLGLLKLKENWFEEMGPIFERHLASLPEDYWTKGNERLENLRQWAAGRSKYEPRVTKSYRQPKAPKAE